MPTSSFDPTSPPASADAARIDTLDPEPAADPKFWRHPILFAIGATVAFFAVVSMAMPLTPAQFDKMTSERKIAYLERFVGVEDDFSVPDLATVLQQAITGDTPKNIIAGATDTDPAVREAGLKALKNLLTAMRGMVDLNDSNMLSEISPQMQESIDALVLSGIRDPQSEHFDAYLDAALVLATEGDKYHAALMEVMENSDDALFKAELWVKIFFNLGPRPEAKAFTLQALQGDSDPQVLRHVCFLVQGLPDPDFIEPLAQIATDTGLPHAPRHAALTALATYGAAAQAYLSQLQGLPHEADWEEGCREAAAQSIRHIEEGTSKRNAFLTLPDDTPVHNVNPLW